jgi:hypothetical protein
MPAGATFTYGSLHNEGSSTGLGNSVIRVGAPSVVFSAGQGAGSPTLAQLHGTVVTTGTAGNMTFQWAQNTSSGTGTKVHATTNLMLRRIG